MRLLVHACTTVKKHVPCDIFFPKFWTALCSWIKWAFYLCLCLLFGNRNVHKLFSALNFTIICLKPFTSNSTSKDNHFSILFKCWMKNYFSIHKHFLLNTSLTVFETSYSHITLTDWDSIYKWCFCSNASIFFNFASFLLFMLFVATFNRK